MSIKTARYCTHYIATLFRFQRGRLDVQTISPESLTDSTSGTCFSVFRPLNRWQFGRRERSKGGGYTHAAPLHARTHTLIKGRWCKLQWTYPCLSEFLCLRQWHVFILTQWRSEQRTDNIETQMMNVFMRSGNLWLNPLSLSHRHTHTHTCSYEHTHREDRFKWCIVNICYSFERFSVFVLIRPQSPPLVLIKSCFHGNSWCSSFQRQVRSEQVKGNGGGKSRCKMRGRRHLSIVAKKRKS